MTNFLISIVIFCVSVFLLAMGIRYGTIGASRLDDYFNRKTNASFHGFLWHFRIPFSFGVIPEYFYAIILGGDNYFKTNWWALKASSFISILLFIAGLKSRSMVFSYFSLNFIAENGLAALFTSGSFIYFLNLIVLLYAALFGLICYESFRMHGLYGIVRTAYYSFLCVLMANLTMITLSLIVFVTVVYVVIKIIGFFFFSSKKKRQEDEEEEETAGSILSGGYRIFKRDLYAWEEERKSNITYESKKEKKEKTVRRRPKISRRIKKKSSVNKDIPRLHPD